MLEKEVRIRVRYSETDQMGFVYYGNYANYFEVARVEALRQAGFVYQKMEEKEGIMMPVLENYSRFISPARYDEELKIQVRIPEKPGVKIRFEYDIYNEKKVLIHQGYTVLLFMDKISQRPVRPSHSILKVLSRYFD